MNKWYGKVFIGIEALMLFLVMFSLVHYQLTKHDSIVTYAVYGEKEYPIRQNYQEYRAEVKKHVNLDHEAIDSTFDGVSDDSQKSRNSVGFISRISEIIDSLETKVENYTYSKALVGGQNYVIAKKKLEKLSGLDLTSSMTNGQNSNIDGRDVIGLTAEGQLGWVQDDIDITERLENLIDFGLTMKEQGRQFVILENPNKYCQIDGFPDFSSKLYQTFHQALEKNGLELIQSGEIMKDMGMTEKDIFFNTDFHWKPSAGIQADRILSEYLNKNCGYDIDTGIFAPEAYEHQILKNKFMGFLGKQVTEAYVEPEDFEIIRPKYQSDLTVFNSLNQKTITGPIDETMFWESRLEMDSLYIGNMYEFYGNSDQAMIRIHNNLLDDGKRILLVKTSFANCMTPYLAAAVENLDIIDLRLFDGSLQKFIEETNPDTVIMIYGLSAFTDEVTEGSLYDFR